MVILPPPYVPSTDMTAGDHYPATNGPTWTITYTSDATDNSATTDTVTIWTDEGETISNTGTTVYYSDPEPVAEKPPEWPAMFAIWEEPDSLPVDHKDRLWVRNDLAFTVWSRAPPLDHL